MALVNRGDVKTLLGISGTTYDDLIELMIKILSNWLPTYLGNKFTNPNLYIQDSTLSFASDTIGDSDSGFVTAGFAVGMDICVQGSQHNDGFYEIDTVSATKIKVKKHSFTVEAAGTVSPIIFQVQYPEGLKMISANIIKGQMTQGQNSGVASETIGDYSVSYDMNGISKQLLQQLSPYRKVGF